MKIQTNHFHIVISILLGLFFIGSAITKLLTIDSFEIFIYSFGLLNLDLSFLSARFIISIEIFIGILLIARIYFKKVILTTIVLLTLFTIFILYLGFFSNSKHCYCFGDLIQISNIASIIKNLILIALFILIYHHHGYKTKYRLFIAFLGLVISVAIPLIISPPDSLFYSRYSKSVSYDKFLLEEFINEHQQFTQGKQILCFYGTGCKFCKLASQKITVIANKNNQSNLIHCVFWGSDNAVFHFYEETNSNHFKYTILTPELFLRITNGEMPMIIMLEDGIIKGKHGYRSINEQEFIEFLK